MLREAIKYTSHFKWKVMLEKSFNMSKWIIWTNDSVSTRCYDPELFSGCNLGKNWSKREKNNQLYYKLHSTCISTINGPIFTNQVALENPKWGIFAHMWDIQKWQQITEISDHQWLQVSLAIILGMARQIHIGKCSSKYLWWYIIYHITASIYRYRNTKISI